MAPPPTMSDPAAGDGQPQPKASAPPGGRPLVAPGRSAPHPILGRDDEVITKDEWQRRLAMKHLADAYPQQLNQTQDVGTRSMLGLFESTGPLLGDDPKRLGRFRVITLATTGIMVGVIFANMPAQDHKGRPTIFASVRLRTGARSALPSAPASRFAMACH
jgi:hypothetical protein